MNHKTVFSHHNKYQEQNCSLFLWAHFSATGQDMNMQRPYEDWCRLIHGHLTYVHKPQTDTAQKLSLCISCRITAICGTEVIWGLLFSHWCSYLAERELDNSLTLLCYFWQMVQVPTGAHQSEAEIREQGDIATIRAARNTSTRVITGQHMQRARKGHPAYRLNPVQVCHNCHNSWPEVVVRNINQLGAALTNHNVCDTHKQGCGTTIWKQP